ncbi:class I SAM-dependent methyltransferase [Terribacillus saccharophilus]|uniref:SAM-dependent methyltransferase n=1 Tax=Terribacillus saccharophilus TaxID=361277 RepID=A0ABX4GZ32_9BACI|nr:class I SAM-dependent methyltransferase [Terribacillus saccharophilus]PAD35516.1 SAM-dependent methyltransferase [Terribacillus saccharophilus]PAD96523.1 SAM-dependent methyltransferase [Terribacillus saccharophilus]PAE00099.1 SAM-dependent methyltransferase [Terribacillus saccharophilus]
MDFHHTKNKWSYTQRNANATWIRTYTSLIENHPIEQALDIGCGGGIYTKALAEMGIPSVIGVDSSEVMLEAAAEYCHGREGISFHKGDAQATGLESASCDLILERALIHHLQDIQPCFSEAYRLLRPGGVLLIQDRTPEDCLLPGNPEHIRGYFFSCFPELAEMEISRRHTSAQVMKNLEDCGFHDIEKHTLWEVRQIHVSKEKLLADIRARLGRSILHALEDAELEKLVLYIDDCITEERDIVESDRWTIWKAVKR